MLSWAFTFLIAAFFAGMFGFGSIAASSFARVVFFASLMLFIALAIVGLGNPA
jgi:uncharacterized membrane protein YtjA (UPF0391 family)